MIIPQAQAQHQGQVPEVCVNSTPGDTNLVNGVGSRRPKKISSRSITLQVPVLVPTGVCIGVEVLL